MYPLARSFNANRHRTAPTVAVRSDIGTVLLPVALPHNPQCRDKELHASAVQLYIAPLQNVQCICQIVHQLVECHLPFTVLLLDFYAQSAYMYIITPNRRTSSILRLFGVKF